MKKILFPIVFFLLLVTAGRPALAQGPDIGIGPGSQEDIAGAIARKGGYSTNVTDTTFSESVGRVIKVALSLVGLVFMVLTIYAGILWMTASGNEEQVTNAINILKRAIIGMIVVVAAYGVTVFVLTALLSTSGVSGGQFGGDIGQKGFWTSFGQVMKKNWYRIMFP